MGVEDPQPPPTYHAMWDARKFDDNNPPIPAEAYVVYGFVPNNPQPPKGGSAVEYPHPPRQAIPPPPLDSRAELWRFAMKLEDDLARLERRVTRLEARE